MSGESDRARSPPTVVEPSSYGMKVESKLNLHDLSTLMCMFEEGVAKTIGLDMMQFSTVMWELLGRHNVTKEQLGLLFMKIDTRYIQCS